MSTRNSRFDCVRIKSTGSYVPSKILTNEEVLANLPTAPEWVVENFGIRERHIAEPEEYTSDLAAHAGLEAIAAAGTEPNDNDLQIVATATPDRKMPSSAAIRYLWPLPTSTLTSRSRAPPSGHSLDFLHRRDETQLGRSRPRTPA
jgi:3-hydroxy-3-methylglutaryl CoA synthase